MNKYQKQIVIDLIEAELDKLRAEQSEIMANAIKVVFHEDGSYDIDEDSHEAFMDLEHLMMEYLDAMDSIDNIVGDDNA